MTQGGFLPLPWSEIESCARLHGIRLKPWEISVVTALDDVWLDIMGRKAITEQDLFLKEEGEADA